MKKLTNYLITWVSIFLIICELTYIQDTDNFQFTTSGILIAAFFSTINTLIFKYIKI